MKTSIKKFLQETWNNPREKNFLKWLSRVLWAGAISVVLISLVTIIVIANSDLPSFEDLENPQYDLASIIYDIHGEAFGKYYIENREFIEYEEISPLVIDALLSVEDHRYPRHAGIDFQALMRVFVKSILLGRQESGGGSTITQQLAKLLFNRPSLAGKSSFQRAMSLASIKFKEWVVAVKLERSYTKEEIIAMYLSKFEFINGAHGIQSAAEIYFNKNQEDLTINEAALLVGMLKNPARYNPVRFTERSEGRRNVVLQMMHSNDKLDKALRDSLMAVHVNMEMFRRSDQSEGLAPYFRAEMTKWLRQSLFNQDFLKPDGTPYDIYRDGLKIYTTIDARYQRHAEAAVLEHMAELQERYWRVWGRINPLTYEANDLQTELRYQSVERRIRDTEVYKSLYQKSFYELSSRSSDQFDVELREPTVRRLVRDREYLNSINSLSRPKFNRLLNSDLWPQIVDQWESFITQVDETFDQERETKLFAYNEEGFEVKEMTARDSLIHMMRFLQAGLLSVDPKTGEVRAWVGGVNHGKFKFDHVTMRRQVGSTIKPFVYATAIGVQGIPPCQEFNDIQYTIAPGDANFNVDAEWSPSNANGLFTQNKYNLYQGLLYSKNSITVRIVKEMGTVELVRDLLHNVGIDKHERINDERLVVPRVPSLVLGSVDLSLMEMTGAYTTFANNGIYTKPTYIDRIEDKNGKIIYQSAIEQRRALNPLYNAVMVDMLQNNTGGGFGLDLKSANGGKTGTTNDYADGWFIGINPSLVTGVWVGGDEKWVRFVTLDNGQGFVMARPIYQKFLKAVEEDEEIGFDTSLKFVDPPPGFRELRDCDSYKQVNPEVEQEELMLRKIELNEFGDDLDEIELIQQDTSQNNY